MVLSGLRKPKWQHRDAAVRLEGLQELPADRQEIFASLVRNDRDPAVRKAAIGRLAEIPILVELAGVIEDEAIRREIETRLADLRHQAILASEDHEAGLALLRELHDPRLLADLAVRAGQPALRAAAVNSLEDQERLAEIVEQNCGREAATAAVARIDRADLLARVRNKAAGKTARRLAGEKLAALETAGQAVDPDAERDNRLQELAAEAERLGGAAVLDAAASQLERLQSEWRQLDPDFRHPAAKIFQSACADLSGRLAEVRQRRAAEAAKASHYEEEQERLEQICLAIEKLIGSTAEKAPAEAAEAENAWQLAMSEGLAPTAALSRRFEQGIAAFKRTRENIEAEKHLVSEIEARLARTAELLTAGESNQAGSLLAGIERELADLKLKHLSAAPLREQQAKLADELAASLEKQRQENQVRRRRLLEHADALMTADNLNKIEAEAKNLRREWQQLPQPAGPEETALAGEFQEKLDSLEEKTDNFLRERDWQLWANLTLKQDLVKKVEGLDEVSDLPLVLETVKHAQASWKEIGPVPQKMSRRLWERFHAACDRNYRRCGPYLEELKEARKGALVRKEEICGLAEELAESDQWRKTAAEIKKLQSEWQELPVIPGAEEHRLFRRFRKACNHFFARRHADYESGAEIRQANLREKEKLCEEVEGIVAAPKFNDAGRIRNLQGRWKKIGPVDREQSDAVWQRFRGACDRYFTWLDDERAKNLARKEELCTAVVELLAEITPETNLKEIGDKLIELQKQWKEIGPVAREQSEEIWQRFHGPIDEFFQARHRRFEEDEEERRRNLDKKEELLRRAEDLAGRENTRETAAALQDLQKEWQEAGSASREVDRELNHQFKELCDSFFAGRRQYFANLGEERLENQRRKEALCLRLENLIGESPAPAGTGKGQALNLAEQLKLALEENIMLAGRRDDRGEIQAEVKRIQEEWKKIGPAERKYEQALRDRFRKALDSFYERQKKS